MKVDFKKYSDHLVPAIVQDASSGKVLMLGYMNEEALNKTLKDGRVCFYSRSKQRLWVKGEQSKNYLNLVDISVDCDQDALLVLVNPSGPTCHKGHVSCFNDQKESGLQFLAHLESVIAQRKKDDSDESYTSSLFRKGINKVAQKVGEEAVEVVIEAKDNNRELFLNESADLLFHYLVLLQAKGENLDAVIEQLRKRRG